MDEQFSGLLVPLDLSKSNCPRPVTLVVLAKAHIPEFFLAASLDDGEKILCQLGWQLDGHWTPVYKHLKIMISTVHNFKFTWMDEKL